ncbi:cathelicidin-B1-like [Rhynochetos jubatus]
MRPCRAVPPLLLLLGLASATTPAPDGSTPRVAGSIPPTTPRQWSVSYGDAVAATVELLNARALSPYVLRLRETQPRPNWSGDLRRRQDLSFAVEETLCRAPGTATAACKTRWLGAVRWCRGSVFLEQEQPMVELSCDTTPIAFGHNRTPRLAGVFARIKERFRGFFQCGKIWIRDKLNLSKPKP